MHRIRWTLFVAGLALAAAACGGCAVFEDLDALRSTEPVCEIDDPCDGCTPRNACGGCEDLSFDIGGTCGTCDTGQWACDGTDAQTCEGDQGDAALNACGACQVLEHAVDEPCGTCDSGSWQCDRNELRCEGDQGASAMNACGGCADLDAAVDGPCGTCDSGSWACDGTEALTCTGDLGDGALNACGSCLELANQPGDACGECMEYRCAAEGGDVECAQVELTDYYADLDEDTFGDPNNMVQSCTTPDGYVTNASDCNDNNENIKPEATEVANDLVGDNDCDGYVLVDPTSYNPMTLGSPDAELGRATNETQHEVTLTTNLLVATTEVTRGWWNAVTGTQPANQTSCAGDACPVECVNWFEALEFLNQASEAEGLTACYTLDGCTGTLAEGCDPPSGNPYPTAVCDNTNFTCDTFTPNAECTGYRLPTEAEWEFAIRANTVIEPFYQGQYVGTDPNSCNESALTNIAWYCGTASSASEPTGQLNPNRFGLYDMAGNVGEWVWDWRGDYPTDPTSDPVGPENGAERIVRGGNWGSLARECRSAERGSEEPVCRSPRIGFRAFRDAP